MIKLPFAGIKGETNSKPVTVQVPCMEMWGETCPVLTEVRPWFKDKSLEDMGRKYWKKKSYLFQGFVVDSKFKEDRTPENPIRRLIINPSIFNTIKGALMDPEMESLFTDFDNGTDFRLTKTTKGQYADYSTSSFARRERGLSEVERAAIEQYGLFKLDDFMPKKPTKEEVDVIYEMFKSSVDGELYDPERFGAYFKPAGANFGSNTASAPAAPASRPAPVATAVLDHVVRSIVDNPDAVRVEGVTDGDKIVLEVRVGEGDLGRVIGRRGRTAMSIRTVVRAAATRDGVDVDVDFVDD